MKTFNQFLKEDDSKKLVVPDLSLYTKKLQKKLGSDYMCNIELETPTYLTVKLKRKIDTPITTFVIYNPSAPYYMETRQNFHIKDYKSIRGNTVKEILDKFINDLELYHSI